MEEYAQMKAREAQFQSLSPSPPLLLPDLQLVMTFIINSKQLDVQKQATVKIQCRYEEFLCSISTICNTKLPRSKKLPSLHTKVVFERAWITVNEFKAHRKRKQVIMASFEDESDFLALQNEVAATKNPRECYLMMNAHIAFENTPPATPVNPSEASVATTAEPAVQQVSQRTVCSFEELSDCRRSQRSRRRL